MNLVSEDIKDMLVSSGLGTFNATSGWGIFVEREPEKEINRTTITIVSSGGPPPERVSNAAVAPLNNSRFQVFVRGTTALTAFAKAVAVNNALDQRTRATVNSAAYKGIFQDSDPFLLVVDGEVFEYVTNFITKREAV